MAFFCPWGELETAPQTLRPQRMLQLSRLQNYQPTASSFISCEEAYEYCRKITAKYSKTFYLGTLLMPREKREAIWAIYVWCRRTDELVDGPEAVNTTPETLDSWERDLESVFAGQPIADPDVALIDSLNRFPLDIQPFRDMIAGQRMDLYRSRYETFEDLKLYCYRVAGTVGLMSGSVMGLEVPTNSAPWDKNKPLATPIDEAVALGIANQLTNILRDVGEDRERGRVYLPLEDLERFNYSEKELFDGVIDERWRSLMKFEITRARKYYDMAESGIRSLHPDARWPVWSALMLYKGILDVIEANDYDVFSKRAYVPTLRKMRYLPIAWLRSQVL
ncbi:phytoene synthase [[Leptolyngbya] sp. PCC 7376]|nr:phytoene synthase [[Leptolyngbya] sp. PCC 7376]